MAEKTNILLIEDDPELREALINLLSVCDFQVWPAKDGAEAIRLTQEMLFPCAITELRMARMNGVQIMKSLLEVDPYMSVLVITAYSFVDTAVEAMREGAYGYITKPFNFEEIKLVVKRAVERYTLLVESLRSRKYHQLSVMDGLTGVFNHRYLHEILLREVSRTRRYAQSFAFLMIDIDNFKNYNDTHGHPAGDDLLKGMSQIFVNTFRDVDMVFRYGGEEFSIILPQTSKQGAVAAAERLLKIVRQKMPTTISIGVAAFPNDADSKDKLIEKTDKALYEAKHSGKDRAYSV